MTSLELRSNRVLRESFISTAPLQSAHVQLGNVPRTLDPAETEGEFHQHDGVVLRLELALVFLEEERVMQQ